MRQEQFVLRMLTVRNTEYCGWIDQHNYPLNLVINTNHLQQKTAKAAQINDSCERLN